MVVEIAHLGALVDRRFCLMMCLFFGGLYGRGVSEGSAISLWWSDCVDDGSMVVLC